MLVLTRKQDQAVVIGDDILVKVIDVTGDYVKLGIEAPKHVGIHRLEVYDAIVKENIQGAESGRCVNKMVMTELQKFLPDPISSPDDDKDDLK